MTEAHTDESCEKFRVAVMHPVRLFLPVSVRGVFECQAIAIINILNLPIETCSRATVQIIKVFLHEFSINQQHQKKHFLRVKKIQYCVKRLKSRIWPNALGSPELVVPNARIDLDFNIISVRRFSS